MNIVLLGYGKMGKLIGEIAEERGHHIAAKINEENGNELSILNPKEVDVAIEFSQPDAAFDNIKWALGHGIPVVSGTTGWLEDKPKVEQIALSNGVPFFYASNYSIGVNIFFKVNRFLANLMSSQKDYKASIEEIHHTQKLDAPSGTAITLADGILSEIPSYQKWVLDVGQNFSSDILPIKAKRIDPAPGTHVINYSSAIDDIEIKHTAHSRLGFATGAVLVAEWILDKKGVLSMDDFLSF